MTTATSSPSRFSDGPAGSMVKGACVGAFALLGSFVVGAPANAAPIVSSFSCFIGAPGNQCSVDPNGVFAQLGDKQIVFKGFEINNPGSGGVKVTYNWIDSDGGGTTFGDDLWTFAVTPTTTLLGPVNVSYSFDVNIVDPIGGDPGTSAPWFFDKVALESDVVTSSGIRVTKFTTPEDNLLVSLDGQEVGPKSYTFLNNYKTINITDSITIPGGLNVLTSVTNSWSQRKAVDKVPGPLSILGAGAAFGMSRRLRRRIAKASIA